MTGLFIALEGPEGAGKSTQVGMLARWLRSQGLDPVVTREPGGTPVGEEARRILLESERVAPETELLLMLAARSALVADVIRPALEAGRVVVTDRFFLSTLAYQVHGRGLPRQEVEAMNAFATGHLAPDTTILLDVDPAVGAARRRAAGGADDRIEGAGEAFHRRVSEAYRLLAGEDETIQRVDGSADPARVHAMVVGTLARRYPETFGGPEGYRDPAADERQQAED
ncbi:MAG TPA: dTMP kinase [Longimicrobiales bacterium]|nr:dTMP kinase [Longimicrobiales bacterium]